jgi:hypothetical protein
MNLFLLAGAISSFAVALLHWACIFWGANGFRILGAGNDIVRLSESGHWYPSFIALVIGAVLAVWSAYALSAGGFIRSLPFLRVALVAITAVYLFRAVGFALLKPFFPYNSTKFWLVTSGICLCIGIVHLVGLIQVWRRI